MRHHRSSTPFALTICILSYAFPESWPVPSHPELWSTNLVHRSVIPETLDLYRFHHPHRRAFQLIRIHQGHCFRARGDLHWHVPNRRYLVVVCALAHLHSDESLLQSANPCPTGGSICGDFVRRRQLILQLLTFTSGSLTTVLTIISHFLCWR
ncbi:hypothetical protein B0H11DRAFT_501466 [Mycena galericulata]|nr:hypothetical protein B0H11DRAFT_501466 [Mycena galericulata]